LVFLTLFLEYAVVLRGEEQREMTPCHPIQTTSLTSFQCLLLTKPYCKKESEQLVDITYTAASQKHLAEYRKLNCGCGEANRISSTMMEKPKHI
jgi:hypothetical protein